MKTTRKAPGVYTVEVHGHTFTLERLYGDRNWSLYNASGVEVNRAETKAGMLVVMSYWSAERTAVSANQEFCTYA
jgi:hypothetical protein